MKHNNKRRAVDQRAVPSVAGIDLEQALNRIDVSACGPAFVYDHLTSSRTFYRNGSRPILQKLVRRVLKGEKDSFRIVECLAGYVCSEVPWAGYYEKVTSKRLPSDSGASEEDIIASGFGWCNEQARVFCALTQIAGMASRLVFGENVQKTYGHVSAEVLTPGGWMAVDPSFGLCFQMKGRPVRAIDICGVKSVYARFEPIYGERCHLLCAEVGEKILKRSFAMAVAPNPLDGFARVAIHNHFIH